MRLQNQGGFGIVESMVGVVIVGIVASVFVDLMSITTDGQRKASLVFNIDQIRRNVDALLANPLHWQATLTANSTGTNGAGSSLACLNPALPQKPDCLNDGKLPFRLFTAGGILYFDPTLDGFTSDGQVCKLSNANCAIKLDLVAQTSCAATGSPPVVPVQCASPSDVVLTGKFSFVPSRANDKVVFNPENYAVSVRLSTAQAATSGSGVVRLSCLGVQNIRAGSQNLMMEDTTNGPPILSPDRLNCDITLKCPTGYTDLGVHAEGFSSAIQNQGDYVIFTNRVRTCIPN